jgi:bacterioferritin-associated ferredoxin
MVNRCICSKTSFFRMKEIIDNCKLSSMDELKEHVEFAENCRLCVPYIDLVFKTGKTEFEPIKFESL